MENTTEDEDGWGELLNQGEAGSGGVALACERPADFPGIQGEPLSPQGINPTQGEEEPIGGSREGSALNGSSSGLAGKVKRSNLRPGNHGQGFKPGGKFSRPPKQTFTDADWTGDGDQPLPVCARGRTEKVKHAMRLFLYGRLPGDRAYTVASAIRDSGATKAAVWNAISDTAIQDYRRQTLLRKERARHNGDAARPEHERREIADLPTLRRRHEEAMAQVARLPITSPAYIRALRASNATAKAIDAILSPSSKPASPIMASKEVIPTPSPAHTEIAGPLW